LAPRTLIFMPTGGHPISLAFCGCTEKTAGYGKSILASKVIDDIQEWCGAEKTRAEELRLPNPNPDHLAYFSCDKANNSRVLEDPNILRCVLRQSSTIHEYPLMRLIVE